MSETIRKPLTREIMVLFKDSPAAPTVYTMAIFDLLKGDSGVAAIVDIETEEVLYSASEATR